MNPLTPYSDVNAFIGDLLARVRTILGEAFLGLYFYGSLASGDFVPGRSDVDFLVLTSGGLSPTQFTALQAMHAELAASGRLPNADVEGVYLPQAALRRHEADGPAIPTLNTNGDFYFAPLGIDWVIQRHTLRVHGWSITGPPTRDLIDPVSAEDLRAAVRQSLTGWWSSRLEDPSWMQDVGYRPYAVLTMCRALHTLASGEIATKDAAARWALGVVDRQWHGLIEEAVAWREGMRFERWDEVLGFIHYTLRESGVATNR